MLIFSIILFKIVTNLILAASATNFPHPMSGGTVRAKEYNHIPITNSMASFLLSPWFLKGLDTIRYLSNANTVKVVIDDMPVTE